MTLEVICGFVLLKNSKVKIFKGGTHTVVEFDAGGTRVTGGAASVANSLHNVIH